MPQLSDRAAILLALLLGCLILGIGAATHNVYYVAPLWLLQVIVLAVLLRRQAREIGRLHTVQTALQRSEERFAKIFQASPAAIVLRRRDDGVYVDANDAFVALTGWSRDELLGRTSAELGFLMPEARAALAAAVAQQGYVRGLDLQARDKHGELRHVLCSVEPVQLDGAPALLTICFDITEHKRMEQELRALNGELRALNEALEERVAQRTAELETALRLKNEFLAMVSHELRTPLTGVLTLAEILEEQVAGPLNARQTRYLDGIRRSGERLLEIINSMLEYTHLISGDVELAFEPCDLTYLLETAAGALRSKAAARRQTIAVAVTPLHLTITSDRSALLQICKRLLDNAIKFTPEAGAVGLAAAPLAAAGGVRIVVWDSGPGIPGGDLSGIVKPFVQFDGSLARSHEGIGMGLAYIDRLLPLLGGALSYEPNPGGGSRFVVTLPDRT